MKPLDTVALALVIGAIAVLPGCSPVIDYNRMLEENGKGRQARMAEYRYCAGYNPSSYPSDCKRVLSNSTVLLDPPASGMNPQLKGK